MNVSQNEVPNQNDQSSHTLHTYALHVKSFKISQERPSVSVQSKSMYVVCKTEKKKKKREKNGSNIGKKMPAVSHYDIQMSCFVCFFFFFTPQLLESSTTWN